MRLNPDCIRDILLTVEENVGFMDMIEINEDNYQRFAQIESYTYDEIGYHIQQCNYSDYFTDVRLMLDGSFMIMDLTPKAHEFIANTRSESIWSKVKEKAFEVGSFSINTLAQIAVNIISSRIG